MFDHYTSLSPSQIIHLINLNCFSLCGLTKKFIDLFKEKAKKGKKCAIINVASMASISFVMKVKVRFHI